MELMAGIFLYSWVPPLKKFDFFCFLDFSDEVTPASHGVHQSVHSLRRRWSLHRGRLLVIKVPSCAVRLQLQKYVLAKSVDYELCELMLERSLVPWAFKALVVSIMRYLYFLVGGPWCILQHQLV
jgi:hypothetical protein